MWISFNSHIIHSIYTKHTNTRWLNGGGDGGEGGRKEGEKGGEGIEGKEKKRSEDARERAYGQTKEQMHGGKERGELPIEWLHYHGR